MSSISEHPSLGADFEPIIEEPLLTRYERIAGSPAMEKARKWMRHPLVGSTGLFTLSVLLGLEAREGTPNLSDRFSDMMANRFTDLTRVNTGPDNVDSVYAEGLSNATLLAAIAYASAGQLIGNVLRSKERRAGVAELPKKWRNQVIVVDPDRVSFDKFSDLLPSRKMALLHGGSLLQSDVLEGGQLMSGTRRHVNSYGNEHLSDRDVLLRLRLQHASHVIFNLWKPDRALFDQSVDSDPVLSPEKVANMLRTIAGIDGTEGIGIDIIAPQNAGIDFLQGRRTLQDHFAQGNFENVHVTSPEDAVVRHVTDRLDGRTIGVVSHVDRDLERALISAGARVVDPSDAQVVAVYLPTDDAVNECSAHIVGSRRDNPTVAALIERQSNVGESQRAGAQAVLIPRIVAGQVIQSWTDLHR